MNLDQTTQLNVAIQRWSAVTEGFEFNLLKGIVIGAILAILVNVFRDWR